MTEEAKDQAVVTGEVVDAPPNDPAYEQEEEGYIEVINKAGVIAFTPGGGKIYLTTTSADSSKWVLPKGHAEAKDTSLAVTAIREFAEEIGLLVDLYSEKPIHITDRYSQGDDEDDIIVERIYWFIGEIRQYLNDGERSIMVVEPSLAIRKVAYEDYALAIMEGVKARADFLAKKVVYMQVLKGQSNQQVVQ